MDLLRRHSAQLSERAWKQLDHAVLTVARHVLTARRIATLDGPRGWEYLATPLGTLTPCGTKEGAATVCVPSVALLAQIRADFSVAWSAVETFERGGPALDTSAAEVAAHEVALAEDRLALYGEPVGEGFLTSADSPRLRMHSWSERGHVLTDLVTAVETLDRLGMPGPYEAVLSSGRYYTYLQATSAGGYPMARHLKGVLADVHRSAVMQDGGGVFATRGGDFILTVGGDLAVGYQSHDAEALHLFCAETVTAQVLTPQAVCILEASPTGQAA